MEIKSIKSVVFDYIYAYKWNTQNARFRLARKIVEDVLHCGIVNQAV